MLTDNGCIFTAPFRNGRCGSETELATLGIGVKPARGVHAAARDEAPPRRCRSGPQGQTGHWSATPTFEILSEDGELLRHLALDPTKDYRPLTGGP